MNKGRGYHAMTVLSDGSVFTLGGSWSGGWGNKDGEVWVEATNQWKNLPGVKAEGSIVTKDVKGIGVADNHMWLFVAPNGNVFQAGPSRRTHWIFTNALGMTVESQLRGDNDAMSGNAVMYDVGKILTLGGAPNSSGGDSSRAAYMIDINVGSDLSKVTIKRTGDMNSPRSLLNSVVLPSGEVVVIGGQVSPIKFSDVGAVFKAEIWNPRTEKFTELSTPMSIPRTYHSVAILGKDGRVITAGGGLCGNCPFNHLDAEILTPPYLLSNTGALATRPVIRSAPSKAAPLTKITVTMDSADAGYTFALMRLSAVTHSVNNDNRRIPLKISSNTGFTTFSLDIPGPSIAIPGTYFLFAMNGSGVPSVATTVVVNV
jgi:galactose oxidase